MPLDLDDKVDLDEVGVEEVDLDDEDDLDELGVEEGRSSGSWSSRDGGGGVDHLETVVK